METNQNTRAGTIGGTLCCVFASIQKDDILKTIVLAAIGATVSFLVSVFLKYLLKK